MLTQITKDDTFVQSLIDEGRITEEEAHTHPQRSLLLRAITGQDVDPSLTVREARAGDRFLLCSDGLSGVVSDETLQDTLQAYRDPRECADRMIELALRGGGPDNVTCIVADVVDIDFGEDDPIMGGSIGGGMDDNPQPDSPAARASAATMTRPAPRVVAPVSPPPPPRSRWRVRLAVLVVAALVLLVGGGALARLWVLQQYFVGDDAEQVAIYQGVRGDVLGIPLNQVAERTDVALESLPQADRRTVLDGITASDGLDGARGVVERLRNRMLPPCSELEPPAPQVVVPPPPPPAPTVAPLPPAGDPNLPGGVAAPTLTPTPELTPLPSETPRPGLNCRPVS
jgi:protein phosphatase